MKKTIILICIALSSLSVLSQEGITLNVSQDFKLAFLGDDKGNDPFTLNYKIRSEWQGKQKGQGYVFVAPEFEYADLQGSIFRRYSVNAGYSFNKWVERFTFTSSIGYGVIDYNGAYRGFGANFQTAYNIHEGVYLFVDWQLLDRKDLHIYNDRKILGSGFFGVKVNIK